MQTKIDIMCPDCHTLSLSTNGINSYGKQKYQYKDCKRQFIGDHVLTYQNCHFRIENIIWLMIARGCGVKDIAIITSVCQHDFWQTDTY